MSNALKTLFQNIADAIRAKTGDTATMKPAEFPEKITSIQTGGGGAAEGAVVVTFCNYDGTELFSRQVFIGDDCPDPLTQGKITAPTKESSEQYTYTYNGWSLSVGGSASDAALKNITEDRTIYAAYTSNTRYYTITYYDGDAVLKTEQYAYGQMPNYEPQKDDYGFIGWEPELTTVTGDKSYYAQWTAVVTFENASWAQIAEISESGKASEKFALGDSKSIDITYGGKTRTVEFEIVGFDLDNLSSAEGKAGITLMSKTTISFNSESSYTIVPKAQTWQASRLRTVTNETIYAGMPENLRNVVKQVSKKCTVSLDPVYQYTDDFCWIPSYGEIGLPYDGTSIDNEIVYPVFTDDATRARNNKYYVRDTNGTSSGYLGYVSTTGARGGYGSGSYYTVLCFCV